ncbi:VWA domain-containing protein [Pseudofrancisella aestuarii]|uniref:VWA domain-containing protein n=1 Tax=Pseudofrancisella aestuarii TaxID=2670347 RepID=A0ABV9TDK0_9GAMM|nr:VWA domain-containing protein [Pseudofrancisella aestuarii]
MTFIHFIRPWWFLAIIPALVIFVLLIRYSHSSNTWLKHCDKHLLEYVVVGNKLGKKKLIIPSFFLLIWGLAIFALAGPAWSYQDVPVYQKSMPRVIALDVSDSMDTTDVSPSRLQRAKYKILDLLKEIREGQTGMIVFSSEPFVVSPLTTDAKTISNLVPVLKTDIVPVQGHDIAKALTKSAELIKQAGFNEGEIILITDSKPTEEAFKEAKNLEDEGIKVTTFAIGTAKGGVAQNTAGSYIKDDNGNIKYFGVDLAALQKLAKVGGGIFVALTPGNDDIDRILADNGQLTNEDKTDNEAASSSVWLDRGVWFIWGLIVLLAILFRKGLLEKVCR